MQVSYDIRAAQTYMVVTGEGQSPDLPSAIEFTRLQVQTTTVFTELDEWAIEARIDDGRAHVRITYRTKEVDHDGS